MRTMIALIALTMAGCTETTAAICTRPDVGTPCAQGTTAHATEGGWTVYLRTTVANLVEYTDAGHACAYTSTRCITEECHFWTDGETISGAEAIRRCKEMFGRD